MTTNAYCLYNTSQSCDPTKAAADTDCKVMGPNGENGSSFFIPRSINNNHLTFKKVINKKAITSYEILRKLKLTTPGYKKLLLSSHATVVTPIPAG